MTNSIPIERLRELEEEWRETGEEEAWCADQLEVLIKEVENER